jgi:D-3-phosphoglycerate dehydrogenase / 2-oxoglutarate reductase
MSRRKVLVTDYTWASTEPEAAVLAQADAELLVAKTGAEEELLALVPDADAILTCFQKVTADVVRAGTKLQVIGRYGIGVDNIAVNEATRLGIPVTNVPAYCLDEVAEHALAFMLAFARCLHVYNPAVREGDWSLGRGAPMYRVSGRTLGILGYGKIGRSLAGKAQGLGLRILAYAPTQPADAVRSTGAEPVDLDELARESDFLSVHLPLTAETRGLVGEELLRSMKPTAFVVNTARGGIVDQDALLRALAEGRIAGAALDVFEPEHLPADHPLLAQPNLIATPHVAFYSEESVHDLEVLAAENVAAILTGRRPRWLVNPEVLDRPHWSHLT